MLHTPNRLPLTMARCPGAGTPFAVSFGAKGSDDLWTHVNDALRERIKCKCGKTMPADEYLRKFHPEAALLNLAANDPKTAQECDFGYHMLHSEVQNFFRDYVRKYTHNPNNAAGLIPCSYTELATGGCAFELKSKTSNMPLGLGMAMKTCPQKPDMTYTTFVVKGDLADNMAKPCDSNTGCGAGSTCKDVYKLVSDERRRRGLWSLLSHRISPSASTASWEGVVDKLMDSAAARSVEKALGKLGFAVKMEAVKPRLAAAASALRAFADAVAEGASAVRAAAPPLGQRPGRRLLALTPSDNDVHSALTEAGLYDEGDAAPGCLTYSQFVSNARAFAQSFFPDATVAKDASYNVCVPNFGDQLDNLDAFAKNTWGAYWDSTGDGKMVIPFSKWDGALKRGNVFDPGRLDGSYFTGSKTALHPPLADVASKTLPVAGATCMGTAYMQIGEKFGGGVQAIGASSMFSFLTEQVCVFEARAKERESGCGCEHVSDTARLARVTRLDRKGLPWYNPA